VDHTTMLRAYRPKTPWELGYFSRAEPLKSDVSDNLTLKD